MIEDGKSICYLEITTEIYLLLVIQDLATYFKDVVF